MGKLMLMAAGAAVLATTAAVAQVPQAGRGDGVQTRAELTQRVQTMFQRVDADRDGAITEQEMTAVRTAARERRAKRQADPVLQQARLDRAFDRLDANKDGAISKAEFAQARELRGERRMARGDRAALRGGMGARMLALADTNGDRRVTLQEATAVALQRFDRMDLDRDGQITREERMEARKQWQAQRRG